MAPSDDAAQRWLDDYIATLLQRDLATLGFRIPASTMRRFWTMLAHYRGQTWNGAELARSIDVTESTIRRFVDALTDAPSTSKSVHSSIETLELDHLYVVYAGGLRFALNESITAVPAADVLLAPTASAVFGH